MSKSSKCIVTITGIRPDFIRMSEVFKKLDKEFNHILIHTGQHFDTYLTDIFFQQLHIRPPDYTLNCGKESKNHYEQLSYLSVKVPELFREKNIKPDLIVFLGDSNTAALSLVLKKEGYTICHIEAGMRSGDKRMLEEINRITCDHCSDLLFVYHRNYLENLKMENITENVHIVGNTITEVLNKFKDQLTVDPSEQNTMILVDIHRPENFKFPDRLQGIIDFAYLSGIRYNLPVKILYFKRLDEALREYNISLKNIEMVPLMGYKEYLQTVLKSKFLISDSGTGQEEPALLGIPVVVPRDYTERPQSYYNNCSVRLKLSDSGRRSRPNSGGGEIRQQEHHQHCWKWLETLGKDYLSSGIASRPLRGLEHSESLNRPDGAGIKVEWLGDGEVSRKIVDQIQNFLNDK